MKMKLRHFAPMLLGLCLFGFISETSALKSGDNVTLVVPYSPGGGFDTLARIAAPYVEGELEAGGSGDIEVIVRNMPGGAGVVANSMIYKAEPNGKQILLMDPESALWQEVLNDDIPYDFKKFTFLGQMSVNPLGLMTKKGLGLDSFDAVIERSQTEPVKLGTSGKGGNDHILPILLEKIANDNGMEVDFEYVHYKGTTPMKAGFDRGEIEGTLENPKIFGIASEDSQFNYLFDFTKGDELKLPYASEVTHLPEKAVASIKDSMNYRRVFAGPPSMPGEVKTTVQNAIKRALKNEELIEKVRKTQDDVSYLSPRDLTEVLGNEYAVASEYASYVKEEIRKGY